MELTVKGMHCKSCEMLIKDSLEEEGAKRVSFSKNRVNFDNLNQDQAKKIINKEGYEVE